MQSIKTVCQITLLVTCMMATLSYTHARSAEGLGRMGRLLASLKSDTVTPLRGFEGETGHPLEKRQIYDSSCKGVYDRAIFNELEHVCDDCYNLYRNSRVASGCRENCFDNMMFETCVQELFYPEDMLLVRDAIRG
uniref:Hyperglycemic hormone isoform n=1 Tax=Callinectes sapidus TaxID=6763 RepID=Q2L9W6_CALSI|nr:hyperglycemic hormone isoform precursor [Callinectes sapidus]ABG67921.1 pericardial organ crustacean hyperglycemic hormone [Callinectes sapidus]ACH85179.1 crustacean hyperglycemic hormone isoform 2 [Callinectes sapidus]